MGRLDNHNTKTCILPYFSKRKLGKKIAQASWMIGVLFAIVLTVPTFAAEPLTFQYIYDDTDQLIKVIDSTGTMVEYFYDETGNRIGVKNLTVSGIAIFNSTPKKSAVGETVTLQSQGFNSTPADNIVKFNGVTASIIAASNTELLVSVPSCAATGRITVSINRAQPPQTATLS